MAKNFPPFEEEPNGLTPPKIRLDSDIPVSNYCADTMRGTIRGLIVSILMLLAADRLPAPVQEIPDTPTPSPPVKAKPKPDRATQSEAREPVKAPRVPRPNRPAAQFAGTWIGTVTDTFKKKPAQWVITVSADERQMSESAPDFSNGIMYGCYAEGPLLHIVFPQHEGLTQTGTLQLEAGGQTALFNQMVSTGSGLFDVTIYFSGRLTKQNRKR